jgi:hypothetical protein
MNFELQSCYSTTQTQGIGKQRYIVCRSTIMAYGGDAEWLHVLQEVECVAEILTRSAR